MVVEPRERPRVVSGNTHVVVTGCGKIYTTVNYDKIGICEVFISLGKSGGCGSAQLEAIGKLVSICLRSDLKLAEVISKLKGIRCPSLAWDKGKPVLSCADAVAQVLEKYASDSEINKSVAETGDVAQLSGVLEGWGTNTTGQCPECSSLLVYQEGCYICRGCGFTRCG